MNINSTTIKDGPLDDKSIYCAVQDVPKVLADLISSSQNPSDLNPVTVIAPNPTSVRSLRNVVGGRGLFNVQFTTLYRIANQISAESLNYEGLKPFSKPLRASVLRRLMPDISGQLQDFNATDGLRESLTSIFHILDNAEPDVLSVIDVHGNPLTKDILDIYGRFKDLSANYYDRSKLLERSVDLLDKEPTGLLDQFGTIIVCAGPDYLPLEISLVRLLLLNSEGFILWPLVVDPEANQVLNRAMTNLGIEPADQEDLLASTSPVENADFLLTTDATEEIRQVVREISAAAESGMPFHRMAIYYGQEFPYRQLIEDELTLADIPIFNPHGRKFKDAPVGGLLSGILNLVDSELPRRDFIDWINNYPVLLGDKSYSPMEWDTISRAANVVGGWTQWKERLSVYSAEKQELSDRIQMSDESELLLTSLNEQITETSNLLAFVESFESKLVYEKIGTWQGYVGWMWELFLECLDMSRLTDLDLRSLDSLENRFEELAALDELFPDPNFDLFRSFILEILESEEGQTGKFGTGVCVAQVGLSAGMFFDLTFLTGVSEGLLPFVGVENPFLPDSLRVQAGGVDKGLSTRADNIQKQRYELYSILGTSNRCVISSPQGDLKEQRAIYPSKWFVELASARAGHTVRSRDWADLAENDWFVIVPSKFAGIKWASSVAYAGIHEVDLAEFMSWHGQGKRLSNHPLVSENHPIARSSNTDTARWKNIVTEWDGDISGKMDKESAQNALKKTLISATMLETYATCPYKFYLRYKLGIKKLETPEDTPLKIEARDKGSLIHKILEEFHQKVQQNGSAPDVSGVWSSDHRQMLKDISQSCFDRWEDDGLVAKGIYWDLEKEYINTSLDIYLNEDSVLRSKFKLGTERLEQPFGYYGSDSGAGDHWEPPVVNLPTLGDLRFRGFIDRIDSNPDGSEILILDLKTGSASPYLDLEEDVFDGGKKLQLPIYLLAARQNLPDAERINAAYWMISFKGRYQILPADTLSWADVEDDLKDLLIKITDGITSGVFPANPGKDNYHCTFCDYDSICPMQREFMWEKKSASDLRLKDYLSMSPQGGDESDSDPEGDV